MGTGHLKESRTERNVQHPLVPLLRQAAYSRLAGYEYTNNAERLAQDPAMRVIVGWRGMEKLAASTNSMSRFETDAMTRPEKLEGLARLNARWVQQGMARTAHRRITLGMDSSESPAHGEQEGRSGPQWPLRVYVQSRAVPVQLVLSCQHRRNVRFRVLGSPEGREPRSLPWALPRPTTGARLLRKLLSDIGETWVQGKPCSPFQERKGDTGGWFDPWQATNSSRI